MKLSSTPLPAAIKWCSLLEAALSRDTPKSRQLVAGSESAIGGRIHSSDCLSIVKPAHFRACVHAAHSSVRTCGRAASAPVLAGALREGNTPC